MSQVLLQQLRATCASMQAAIAELERGGVVVPEELVERPTAPRGRGARPVPAKKVDPHACPNPACGAPRSARQSFGGFGGSKAREICGRCAYEFKATD